MRLSGNLLLINPKFHLEHGSVEGGYRKTMTLQDSRFPSIRNALFKEKRLEVLHMAPKYRE
jgi:hypothetical protein